MQRTGGDKEMLARRPKTPFSARESKVEFFFAISETVNQMS
jgi:hypothetical protein